jgi:uncharacterized oxidoreductase
MPTFLPGPLEEYARALFVAGGLPAADAAVVARGLVLANLCGHDSHGIIRVPQYLQMVREGKLVPGVDLTVVHETPALVVADANWGFGQVQAHRLLGRLVGKARAVGVAAGTLRNCGHIGRLGEYAEDAAAAGLAFAAFVNSHGFGGRVAPPGGTAPRLSTNPVCLGGPTPDGTLVLDLSTSAVAEGKVRVAYQKGESVPEGWLLDAGGRPTTDPAVLYTEPRGSLLPFGGAQAYKGFGLALLIDLFAGALSGGGCSSPHVAAGGGNAVLFVLFDTTHFGGTEAFLREAGAFTAWVRSSPPADGVTPVTMPGDPERAARARREREGVSLPEGTWRLLADEAGRLGVAVPGA